MKTESREIKIHGIYRHFKNKYYIVEDAYNRKAVKKKLPVASFLGLSKNMAREIYRAVAYHSETKEEYVVYRRLYDDNSLWIREKQMFKNFQDTIDILAEKNLACDCQHVTDLQQVMSFGVMSLPGLVINDKVVSYGKILSKADILKFIES